MFSPQPWTHSRTESRCHSLNGKLGYLMVQLMKVLALLNALYWPRRNFNERPTRHLTDVQNPASWIFEINSNRTLLVCELEQSSQLHDLACQVNRFNPRAGWFKKTDHLVWMWTMLSTHSESSDSILNLSIYQKYHKQPKTAEVGCPDLKGMCNWPSTRPWNASMFSTVYDLYCIELQGILSCICPV